MDHPLLISREAQGSALWRCHTHPAAVWGPSRWAGGADSPGHLRGPEAGKTQQKNTEYPEIHLKDTALTFHS